MFRTALLLATFALALTACDTTGPDDEARIEANVVTELAADPVGVGPMGPLPGTGQFALYSLRDGELVLAYDEADRSDSLTTAWDIGFNKTTIIINGGTSGPGMGGAVVLEEVFDDVTEVPADAEFRVDGVDTCEAGEDLAICTLGGNGWYTYIGGATPKVLPTPGRTILVRTADGEGYAKVRINNYYQGQPTADEITASTPGRYYTFEYVVNTDGTSFETAAE